MTCNPKFTMRNISAFLSVHRNFWVTLYKVRKKLSNPRERIKILQVVFLVFRPCDKTVYFNTSISTHIWPKLCFREVANFGYTLNIDWSIAYRPINQNKKAFTLLLMCMNIFTKYFERKFEVSISLSLFPNFTASHRVHIKRNEPYTGRKNEKNEAVSFLSFILSSFFIFLSFYIYYVPYVSFIYLSPLVISFSVSLFFRP